MTVQVARGPVRPFVIPTMCLSSTTSGLSEARDGGFERSGAARW